MIRKDVIFAVLATFCLTTILFTVIPVGSYGIYDPWIDFNDDGKIDVKDVALVASNYGSKGTPINKTELLLDLQNRVSALEEKQDYVKTIRFYEPNETMQNNGTYYKNAAVFYWNPQNASNNAILGGYCYFKYLATAQTPLYWHLKINGTDACWEAEYGQEYEQSVIYPFWYGWSRYGIKPNQDTYRIEFNIASTVPTYVKDINVLLEVMDGLPPS
jgi:hypothetical protein